MICTKCRREIPDDAVLCCYCGKRYIIDRSRKEKRGNGQGSVFKISSGWVAQITVGSRPIPDLKDVPPGDPSLQKKPQQIRRSKYGFATRKEAMDYLPILKAAGSQRPDAPPLSHYWDIYKDGELDRLSASKKTAYRGAWEKLKAIHTYRVDAITVADLRRTVSAKCKSYYTARDCRSVLSALFKLAAAEGYANKDLPSFIVLPKLEEKEKIPFSETEQKALWNLYDEKHDIRAAIPLLMIYTGMMPGEAMKLKVDQIDIESRRITGAGMKTKVRKETPIVLADQIIPLVQDLIDHAMKSGYLWLQDEKVWYADYYAALAASGCRRLTPYSCRHTTATALAITKGIAPQTVQKIMRWSSSRMLDRYAHPDQDDALAGVNQI